MKRLLAVSWEMPPMYGPRATQVTRTLGALVPLGWQSTVVCLKPRRGGPHWPDGAPAQLPNGVEALRVASPEEWLLVRAAGRVMPTLRERPDSKWVWIAPASAAAERAAARTRFDGVVTFAQPWSDHLIGLRVHRATKLPWVAHFSDPWIGSPYFHVSPGRRAAAAQMEADVIREAAAVVFVTDETADFVMNKYPSEWRRKVAVVPHGFEPAPLPRRPRPDGPLRIVYAGRFYEGLRTPSSLLRALSGINVQQPLAGTLEVTCIGPHVTQFAREAKALGIGAFVHFRDRVTAAEARELSSGADVLLVADGPVDGPSPFLPSKLVDYLPLRKPILGITPVHGASASLLRRLGCPVAAPDDEVGISDAILTLVQQWRGGRLAVSDEFDRVAAEFDITRTTAAFSDVLTRAFGSQAG